MAVHIDRAMNCYADKINRVFREIEKELSDFVYTLIPCELAWTRRAGTLCVDWETEFNTQGFLNLLKRDGHRRGNYRIRWVDLSDELVEISSADVDDLFNKLNARLRHHGKNLSQDLEDLVSQIVQDMKGELCNRG